MKQVRVQPSTNSNVVNYTVVISAENSGSLLLPGMTATVNFVITQKTNVLRVPNAALRFTPGSDELAAIAAKQTGGVPPPPGDSSAHVRNSSPGPGDRKRLFYLDEHNVLSMEPVITGITDGTYTEIVQCRHLAEGAKVISGSDTPSPSASTASSSKMQGGPPGGMPPPM